MKLPDTGAISADKWTSGISVTTGSFGYASVTGADHGAGDGNGDAACSVVPLTDFVVNYVQFSLLQD